MSHIDASDANAWADKVKLNIVTLDDDLEAQVSNEILGMLATGFTTTGWVDEESTPLVVKKIIAMTYTGWYYQRAYSEDNDISTYGTLLISNASTLVDGILNGAIILTDTPIGTDLDLSAPAFYPDDNSSSMEATIDDMSLGPAKFSMGSVF